MIIQKIHLASRLFIRTVCGFPAMQSCSLHPLDGLRHSSATYQLMISGGDVKAVQSTTGHATADMLVNTYAHIQQSSRVELGRKFEEGFYAKQESPSPQAVPAAGEPTISMTALLELLKNADPEVKAQLRLALLT